VILNMRLKSLRSLTMIEDTIETGRQYASTTPYEGIGRVTREMQEMIYADEDPMGTGDNVPKYEEFLRVYSYIMIDQWNESMGGESEQSEEKARGPWSLYLANLSQKVPKKLKFLEDDLPAWRQQIGDSNNSAEDDEEGTESDDEVESDEGEGYASN
jgi:hypothetical protein